MNSNGSQYLRRLYSDNAGSDGSQPGNTLIMKSDRVLYLLEKFREHTLNDAEWEELERWYQSLDLSQETSLRQSGDVLQAEEMLREFRERYLIPQAAPVKRLWSWRWVAAAMVTGLLFSAAYFLFPGKGSKSTVTATDPQQKRFGNDVNPGKHRAMLTLANGERVPLDSVHGLIPGHADIKASNRGGLLAYHTPNAASASEMVFNTVSTARGETYAVRLSDGTQVWLNSGSSIRFPVPFSKDERLVTITGEVYFEVAQDASRPFRVKKPNDDFTVNVLGTHFDVNTYDDEETLNVSLLEGSVRVNRGGHVALLKPGQQARLSGGNIKVMDDVDMERVTAWKDGLFYFKDADIREIMRQAARWYDIEVEYQGTPSTEGYNGRVSKDTKLSELLKVLELTNVRFIIEGKKITVIY
jgi:ferric-dicitrate binding protein FerR (iron transport regulator)